MPTLRRINNKQLKIQRTGTLQMGFSYFFFCLFCFSKKNRHRERRPPALHVALTVTGAARGGMNHLWGARGDLKGLGASPLPTHTQGVPGRCSLRDGSQALISFFYRNPSVDKQDLIVLRGVKGFRNSRRGFCTNSSSSSSTSVLVAGVGRQARSLRKEKYN